MKKKAAIRFSIIMAMLISVQKGLANNDNKSSKKIALDQSQQIFFEQFSIGAFSLQLLQVKDKFKNQTLIFGGMLEGDLQDWQGEKIPTSPPGNYQAGNGVYFTEASLDVLLNMASWVETFLSISEIQIGQSAHYFYLPHAFLTLGNLKHFPAYLTAGINTLPFGVLTGTGTWDTPLTSTYFNVQQVPQINLGFYKNNLNLNALAFQDEVNYENHFASSLSYHNALGDFNYSLGAGYLTHLKTNSTGSVSTLKNRRNIVPEENLGNVWDANASIGYKLATLAGEYLSGSDPLLTATGLPVAYSLTLSIIPTVLGKATTFAINHSASLNFNNIPATLPGQDAVILAASGLKSTWAMSVSRPIIKNNITLGLDVEQAITYDNAQTFAYTLDLIIYI